MKKLAPREEEVRIDQGFGDRLVLYVFSFDNESSECSTSKDSLSLYRKLYMKH